MPIILGGTVEFGSKVCTFEDNQCPLKSVMSKTGQIFRSDCADVCCRKILIITFPCLGVGGKVGLFHCAFEFLKLYQAYYSLD